MLAASRYMHEGPSLSLCDITPYRTHARRELYPRNPTPRVVSQQLLVGHSRQQAVGCWLWRGRPVVQHCQVSSDHSPLRSCSVVMSMCLARTVLYICCLTQHGIEFPWLTNLRRFTHADVTGITINQHQVDRGNMHLAQHGEKQTQDT